MERRWTTRAPISFDVDLYCEGYEVAVCTTSDISYGGVFLALDHGMPLEETIVHLVFHFKQANERNARYKLPAKVARVTSRGIGLEFCDFDAAAFRTLREMFKLKEDCAA